MREMRSFLFLSESRGISLPKIARKRSESTVCFILLIKENHRVYKPHSHGELREKRRAFSPDGEKNVDDHGGTRIAEATFSLAAPKTARGSRAGEPRSLRDRVQSDEL